MDPASGIPNLIPDGPRQHEIVREIVKESDRPTSLRAGGPRAASAHVGAPENQLARTDNSPVGIWASIWARDQRWGPRYKHWDEGVSKWVVDPASWWRSSWDMLLTTFLLWVAVTFPLRFCFESVLDPATGEAVLDVPVYSWQFWINTLIDVSFFGDLCLNFVTAYEGLDDVLVVELAKIRSNYLRGWFTVDLLACIQFGYLADLSILDGGILKALRLLRVTKLLRLSKVIPSILAIHP